MRSKEIKKAIDSLGPWYQRFEMEGQFTTESRISGEPIWPEIRSILPEEIDGLNILEIGSNAAYYSAMLVKDGANVTAIEPNKKYFLQGRWTQYFFEQYGDRYPIEFIHKSIDKIKYEDLGWFDYILLSTGLDLIQPSNPKRFLLKLFDCTDKLIIITKNDSINNSIGYYNSLFLEHDIYILKRINTKTPILMFGRLVKEPIFIEQINKMEIE